MTKSFIPKVASLAALGFALMVQHVQAFTFPEINGAPTLVAVVQEFTGEVWAQATTESWEATNNTVWAHCENVLGSYGAYTAYDIKKCQNDVARANNTTERSLGRLKVGENIILPLARPHAEKLLASEQGVGDLRVKISTLQTSIDALEDRVAQQGNLFSDALTELQLKLANQNTALIALQTQVGLLATQVTSEKTVSAVPASVVVGAPSQEVQQDAVRAPPAELPLWVTWAVLGIYAFIALMAIIFALLWQAARRRGEAAVSYARIVEGKLRESELDFSRKPYVFDGKDYWVELKRVTKEGHFFTTPFADEVKEQNLKSHFAQATKEKTELKQAA